MPGFTGIEKVGNHPAQFGPSSSSTSRVPPRSTPGAAHSGRDPANGLEGHAGTAPRRSRITMMSRIVPIAMIKASLTLLLAANYGFPVAKRVQPPRRPAPENHSRLIVNNISVQENLAVKYGSIFPTKLVKHGVFKWNKKRRAGTLEIRDIATLSCMRPAPNEKQTFQWTEETKPVRSSRNKPIPCVREHARKSPTSPGLRDRSNPDSGSVFAVFYKSMALGKTPDPGTLASISSVASTTCRQKKRALSSNEARRRLPDVAAVERVVDCGSAPEIAG